MARKELIEELMMVEKDMNLAKMAVLYGRGYTAKEISLILGVPESGVEGYIKLCQKTQREVKDSVSED
jgi:hypothetical protein|nr:MAG TPA: RNA polymerase sigma factor [Caudoviricetes sp.]